MLKILEMQPEAKYQETIQGVLETLRESPVSPDEFIKAFQQSRRLVFSKMISPDNYFQQIKQNLESGVAPEAMLEYMQQSLDANKSQQ